MVEVGRGGGGGAAEMDVAASLAQGKTIRVATVHLAAARKKNLESKVASKGPMLHPATTAHLSTEKALQEFDSLFSDTRKLLLTQFMPMVTSSTPPRHRLPFTGGAQTANATRSKDRGSERTAKVLTGCIGAINIGRGCVHCMTIRCLASCASVLQFAAAVFSSFDI